MWKLSGDEHGKGGNRLQKEFIASSVFAWGISHALKHLRSRETLPKAVEKFAHPGNEAHAKVRELVFGCNFSQI
jgi:hypothetical protein